MCAKKHLAASERMGMVNPIDNHADALRAKIKIREYVYCATRAEQNRVLDVFCGVDGLMYKHVWKRCALNEHGLYVGIDQEWPRDERRVFVGDNRRILRAIDLDDFNIFDLDSHGAPWEQAVIIAHRREWKRGERVGFVFTDASGLKLVFDRLPKATSYLSGLPQRTRGSFYARELVFDACLDGLMKIIGGKVVDQWRATRHHGAAATYAGIIVEIH